MLHGVNKRADMSLPQETLAHIVALVNAAEDTESLDAVCHADRETYQVCQIPFLQRDQLRPSLQSFLLTASLGTSQGNLVSPLQVLEASRRLQQMVVCVRYALYSALVIATQEDPLVRMKGPLLTFDEFARQDSLAPRDRLFAPIITRWNPYDYMLLRLLTDGSTQLTFFSEPSDFKSERCTVPDTSMRALVNRALGQAAIEAIIDTDSVGRTPAMCASVDLFAAYPQLSHCLKVSTPGSPYQEAPGRYHEHTIGIDLYPIFHSGMERPIDDEWP